MRRKKILIKPILRDRNGDVSKKWYVELSQRNPETDELVRKRFEVCQDVSINSLKNLKERYALAEKIIEELDEKIKSGWTIFCDTEAVVYEDITRLRLLNII
jgi:precorrin isomerase